MFAAVQADLCPHLHHCSMVSSSAHRTSVWIFFDNLSLEDAHENLIKRQVISLSFFVRMICYPYVVLPNRFGKVFYSYGLWAPVTIDVGIGLSH